MEIQQRFILVGVLAALLLILLPLSGYSQPIIADHTVVDEVNNIPEVWLDEVKKMWVVIAGESHSSGYRIGCHLLEGEEPLFDVNVQESGAPEEATDAYLRLSRATWGDVGATSGWRYGYGEEDWYTSTTAVQRTTDGITYSNTGGFDLAAIGFGWCWDMTWHNSAGGGIDSVYQVRWAGSSVGGPDGDLRWGLDAGDIADTSNSVTLDTYLDACDAYINHCTTNGYSTTIIFTTGPVDGGGNTGERGYQRFLKNEGIRQHVLASSDKVLFDYADILCWSDAGEQNMVAWTDHGSTVQNFPFIHSDNMLDIDGSYTEDGDHIGQRGALRLGKALWWLLARVAGWDGSPSEVTHWQAY